MKTMMGCKEKTMVDIYYDVYKESLKTEFKSDKERHKWCFKQMPEQIKKLERGEI